MQYIKSNKKIYSTSQPQLNQDRKISEQSVSRNRKQSLHSIKQSNQQDFLPQSSRQFQEQNSNLNKKGSLNQPFQSFNSVPRLKFTQSHQQLIAEEKMEETQRRDYLALKVTPVLNKMLVKIVNEKPVNTLKFMIQFLRKQEQKYQVKRFNDQARNDAMSQQKNFQQLFDSTVATKFLKFKR